MTDKLTDEELSRKVAEKLRLPYATYGKSWEVRNYATDWSLIGPEIEKRYGQATFMCLLNRFVLQEGETLPRAACLAILEEQRTEQGYTFRVGGRGDAIEVKRGGDSAAQIQARGTER